MQAIWEENRKLVYNLGDVKIVEVSEEKDIGMTFDQQLSFGINASKVVQRQTRGYGLQTGTFLQLEIKLIINSSPRPIITD